MAEKEPAFVVVDRRKFTAQGEIREGYVPPPAVEQAAPETPLSPPHAEPSAAAAPKVVTMPTRSTVEAEDRGAANDPGEESLGGAGYDVDGDGLSSDEEAFNAEQDMLPGPAPSAAETATQHRAYQAASRDMDALLAKANPGMKPSHTVGFEHIVQSFYLSAIMAMGAGAEPGQKPRIDILGARQSIDMLTVLADKTRGQLDEKEQRLLEGVTFELRMMFLELSNAIAAQAQQAPPLGRK